MKTMKLINAIYNVLVIVLALLVINYFLKLVAIPSWLMMGVFLLAALLFFIRFFNRFGKR